MDEINEKAIRDIIDYYDKRGDFDELSEESSEAEAPSLVDIIEEAQLKKESAKPDKTEDTPSESLEEEPPIEAEADAAEAEAEEAAAEEAESEASAEEAEAQTEADEEEPCETGEENDAAEEAEAEFDFEEENDEELPELYEPFEDDGEAAPKKKSKLKYFIIAALIAAFAVAFVKVDTGFIGAYKRNASKNISIIIEWLGIDLNANNTETENISEKKTPKFKTSVKNSVTVPMETAGKSVFFEYTKGIVCAYTNYLALIGTDGSKIWENTTTVVNPILKAEGNYILIAEKGGKTICLYNDSRLVYEANTEDNILSCALSSNGDVVAVTDKYGFKGAVAVFNREGKQIFAWSSGSDNILNADISPVSRRVAVALLNTDDRVKSTVQLFDINETQSPAQVIFDDTIIFSLEFSGDTLNAVGDNCIAGITARGDLIYDKRFDGVEFVHYGADGAGNKILLFDNTNIPLINVYDIKGELKNQLSPEELPDFVDISGKYIVYNSGRDIIFGKAGKKKLEKYTTSMDIKQLMMFGDNTFVIVYSNNFEIIKV